MRKRGEGEKRKDGKKKREGKPPTEDPNKTPSKVGSLGNPLEEPDGKNVGRPNHEQRASCAVRGVWLVLLCGQRIMCQQSMLDMLEMLSSEDVCLGSDRPDGQTFHLRAESREGSV